MAESDVFDTREHVTMRLIRGRIILLLREVEKGERTVQAGT